MISLPGPRLSKIEIIYFSLAKRGDPVAGQDKRTNLALGILERDHKLLALRLVGRARLSTALRPSAEITTGV